MEKWSLGGTQVQRSDMLLLNLNPSREYQFMPFLLCYVCEFLRKPLSFVIFPELNDGTVTNMVVVLSSWAHFALNGSLSQKSCGRCS